MNRVHETSLHDINKFLPERIDTFIASASFESRSLQISHALDRSRVQQTFIAFNANHKTYNQTNCDKLSRLFESTGSQFVTLDLNSDDPVATADAFLSIFKNRSVGDGGTLVVDISTFTREALAILLVVLRSVAKNAGKITLLYNPAKSYGDPEKLWLSKGLRGIRSILGYSGFIVPSRPNHLIILPGYELERASNVIARYEPNFVSIGVLSKEESFAEDFYQRQIEFVRQLKNSYSSQSVDTFNFSARNPFITEESVLGCLAKQPSANKIVIPLNSKLAVVGACLACFERSDLQMGYAQPEAYNLHAYSEPSELACLIDVDLHE